MALLTTAADRTEYTFSGSARAGDYLYIASETAGFTSFFGFAPTGTARAANINGDDAIELFQNGTVIDVFGQPDVDGTGQPWDYQDGWAYRRSGTSAEETFNLSQWTFSSPGTLNTPDENDTAAVPFPIGTFVTNLSPEDPVGEGDSASLTLISEIQGNGTASPLVGTTVTVEAIAVGDFQGEDGLGKFYLQEEDAEADGEATTSEGLFVFDEAFGVDVAVGDKVTVSGTVSERFNALTALIDVTAVETVGTEPLPTAAALNFPLASRSVLESVEGMRVTIPDPLFVTEYFNYDRFGEWWRRLTTEWVQAPIPLLIPVSLLSIRAMRFRSVRFIRRRP